jgi:hypothetical protein
MANISFGFMEDECLLLRSEVFTAIVKILIVVFRVVTTFSLLDSRQHFG